MNLALKNLEIDLNMDKQQIGQKEIDCESTIRANAPNQQAQVEESGVVLLVRGRKKKYLT
jgi:hypothetical protein